MQHAPLGRGQVGGARTGGQRCRQPARVELAQVSADELEHLADRFAWRFAELPVRDDQRCRVALETGTASRPFEHRDLACHLFDQRSVTDLLGADKGWAGRASVGVYGSGVNRHYPLDELVAQAQRWRDAGCRLVKMKVGGHPLAEDIDRVTAVRETIGPDAELAIDANQLWSLDEAERAIGELSRFGLRWIEEPLRADDLLGHAALRSRIEVPIALGENLHTAYRFREAIALGAADILQPNVIRVGGITPFLAIAELADASGVEQHPHLLPELSGQLALALPQATLVEDVEDAGFERLGLLAEPAPVRVADATLTSTGRPGLGITFA